MTTFCTQTVGHGQNFVPNPSFETLAKIENLKTFAKVYGYVKYFHPSDQAANIDWEKFSIYGSGKVEKCQTKEELFKTLHDLFYPIAPTIKFYYTEENVKFDINSITPTNLKNYKPTYWQHLGVSNGMKVYQGENIYRSIRVNRKIAIDKTSPKSAGFGNLMTYVDAQKYNGRIIKFTGEVKLIDGSKGTGHLWLRVDKPNRQTGFFNNMDNSPITENGWKKYEIIGDVDTMAIGIALGCFLEGSGELLTDDLKLFYQENEKWIEIPIKNNDFESDELGTSMKEKTWIYWGDDYSIKIVSEDSFEGKKCVSIKKNNTTEIQKGKKIFEAEPTIGEAINKNIGSGISCIVPLVLYCTDSNTYPESKKNELDSILKTINTKDIDLPVRLGDIIITWNVFQHFFPYFDVANVDWEKELGNALLKSYEDKNENDFLITLQQFTAPLKDGHIWVSGGSMGSFTPPIAWEFIENKLTITKVCDSNLRLKVGDIVTQINGVTPEKYFENIERRISAATSGWLAYRANTTSLTGDKDSKLSIVVNNTLVELTRNIEPDSRGCDNSISSSNFKYKLIGNDIIYLNLDLIEMKTIDSLLPQLTKAKAVICDLRGYPNGNHELISYLLTKNDKDKWMFVPEFIYPDQEKIAGYEKGGWEMKAKKPHINAKIIFITDGSAISYSESYMGFIEGYKLATIVGQPTAGTNGNVNSFVLPGHYQVSWTGMKVIKHDGSQQHGVGIIPNVFVSKTIKGVIESRDEFLETAIELANEAK